MIEKELEAKIVTAIEALEIDGLAVSGTWQATADGIVKGLETDSSPGAVSINVQPRNFDTFTHPIVSIPVRIVLVVRMDLCPTGGGLETYVAPVLALLDTWNRTLSCVNSCGLGVANEFEPGGLSFSGGDGPEYNRATGVWSVTLNLTIQGVVLDNNDER